MPPRRARPPLRPAASRPGSMPQPSPEPGAREGLSAGELARADGAPARKLKFHQREPALAALHHQSLLLQAEDVSRLRKAGMLSGNAALTGGLRLPDAKLPALPERLGHRPGVEGAHLAPDLLGAAPPVDPRFRFVDLRGVRNPLIRLYPRAQ